MAVATKKKTTSKATTQAVVDKIIREALAPFNPSPQQFDVFRWIKLNTGNAFIQAVAGAGKTTTLINAIKLMEGCKVLLVAYNNKIKDEASNKLAIAGLSYAEARTFHSIGWQGWRNFTGLKYIQLNGDKSYNIVKELKIEFNYVNFIKKIVSHAKNAGIGCTDAIGPHMDINNLDNWMDIVTKHGLGADLPEVEGVSVETGIQLAISVLKKSQTMRNYCDFDDQIYMPLFYNIQLPVQYDWILVDESQDTNEVRRTMARKLMLPHTRLIWVGDVHQAIYGFTGADADAVQKIVTEFQCKELPLTVTYRCPKEVVKFSQTYVSHIQAHESAPEGEVKVLDRVDFDKLTTFTPLEDAILCRKNAPLVDIAYKLIRLGVPCQIEGKADLGKMILATLKKWKKIKHLVDLLDKITEVEAKEIAKYTDEKTGGIMKNKEAHVESIKDRYETIRFLCEGCETIECVQDKVENMFGDTKPGEKPKRVILSSVHKSKGLEWKNVYIIGFNEYMPSPMARQPWQQEQEKNLIYVAATRAMNTLTLVG